MNNHTRKGIGVKVYLYSILLLVSIMLLCCSVGRYFVSWENVFRSLSNYLLGTDFSVEKKAYNTVVLMRLPRVLMSVMAGASLSIAGCVYQSVFNNRLISPDLLGVTNGSCVGAALAILLSWSGSAVMFSAFSFGVAAVLLSLLLTVFMGSGANITLLLSGIIVSAIFSSCLGLIKYMVDSLEKLETITFWIMGSLSSVTMREVRLAAPFIIISASVLVLLRYHVNIISLGSTEAELLGVPFRLTRILVIVCATVLTACTTAVCGTISWIGLIIPHIARLAVGSDNRKLIPFSMIIGTSVLPLIDTLCRCLTVNEIPISILSAAFGAVTYGMILMRRGRILHD